MQRTALILSKASCSVFDHFHGASLLSKLYNVEAIFAKSGTNLRRKFADPGKDCYLETHITGAASFMACTFSPEGEIPAAEMVLGKGTQVNGT